MTRSSTSVRQRPFLVATIVLATLFMFQTVRIRADQFQALVGAQSDDQGRQALAFLPSELWIHTGDSITWAFPIDEPHTLTFLAPNQPRPFFLVGCPGSTPSGGSFPTIPCVNSDLLLGGATYTVSFPTAGNFKFVCLLHGNMTGVVHVLDVSETLPHDQQFYDREARRQAGALLRDGSKLADRGVATAERTASNAVSVGIGEIVATGGGSQTMSVMRFMRDQIVVHVGETVEWTNLDPVTPHTVTFGTEPQPQDLFMPSNDVGSASDGALKTTLVKPDDSTHSGLLAAAPQDQLGLPQPPPGTTRFRVTFQSPGTYHYICALHDDLGMKGIVTVLP